MNKKFEYTINGLILGGIIKMLLNGIEQFERLQNYPTEDFNWEEFLKEGGKGALIGGATGFVIGAIEDEINETVKPINTDKHLKFVVNKIQVRKDSSEYISGTEKCSSIIEFLKKEFNSDLAAAPYIWGSMTKGTAIKGKSDFDIRAQFKRSTFSLEEMYETLYETFNNKFYDKHLIRIRKQRKSIGILFDMNGTEVKIDVVPERKISDYSKDASSNLYVKPDTLFSNASSQKTNIKIQASQTLSETQKKLLMTLKKWKADFEVPLSSYMLELFIKRAYLSNTGKVPNNFTGKLIMVLRYIEKNIETDPLQSVENTNNRLNNLSTSEKDIVKSKVNDVLNDFSYQPNSLLNYFGV